MTSPEREMPTAGHLVDNYEKQSSMDAIGLKVRPALGQVAEALELMTVPTPRPAPKEVAIKVVASSIDIDEIYAAQGTGLGRFGAPRRLSSERPHLMGSAVSGVVVGLGRDVDRFGLGDEVIVIPGIGPGTAAWATFYCTDQDKLMLKPPSLSHPQAAATVLGACVAWAAIALGRVQEGDHCIVVGASGSIGAMMTAFLASLGCDVSAVGGGAQRELMLRNGATNVIDYRTTNFADHAVSSGNLADAVFDCVGGRETERDGFRALSEPGTFVTVVGPRKYVGQSKLSRREVARTIAHVIGRMATTRFRARRYDFGARPPRSVIHDAFDHAVRHNIHMPIAQTVPFEISAVKAAVAAVYAHEAKGRVVIDFNEADSLRTELEGVGRQKRRAERRLSAREAATPGL